MTTLRETVFSTLQGDATLRTALSKTATPYGVYAAFPSPKPVFPIVTVAELAAQGDFPRAGHYQFTVWYGNIETISVRIYDLLHNKAFSVSDFGFVTFLFDWSSPEMYDDNWHINYRHFRYAYTGIKAT
jgi:hypothetical protein